MVLRRRGVRRREYGYYDRLLSVQERALDENGRLYDPVRWVSETPVAIVPAQLRRSSGNELFTGDAVHVEEGITFRVRFRPDITQKMSVVDEDGVRWSIQAIELVGLRDKMDLVVTRVDSQVQDIPAPITELDSILWPGQPQSIVWPGQTQPVAWPGVD